MNARASFIASYRLQLHRDFTFEDAAELCDYLSDLGISHVYVSPIFSAQSKSTHGYDLCDPRTLSQERGGDRGFDVLMKSAARQTPPLSFIVDFVPNHMAASSQNPAFADLLREGPLSSFFSVFDIYESAKKGPLLVLPVLGAPREEVVAVGQLKLALSKEQGFALRYYDHIFPLSYLSCALILYRFISSVRLSPYFAQQELDELERLAEAIDREQVVKRPHFAKLLTAVHEWLQKSPTRRSQLEAFLTSAPPGFIQEILDRQFYVLDFWKTGHANYRRFFDVNELIATKMDNPNTQAFFHQRLNALFQKYTSLCGLRLDHIDGLKQPAAYLEYLSNLTPHVWVEKILCDDEALPADWKTHGTTGYDFLNALTHALVDSTGFERLQQGQAKNYAQCERESRQQIIDETFRFDFERLAKELKTVLAPALALDDEGCFRLLREIALAHPVYRLYASQSQISQVDHTRLIAILQNARKNLEASLQAAIDVLMTLPKGFLPWLERFQQFSGAAFAKGVEDTLFYRYYPLLALNEVGGHPVLRPDAQNALHSFLKQRQEHTPLTLNTSSTHDTKRSEDARARLIALSYHAEEWLACIETLQAQNPGLDEHLAHFVYQTLLSVWPLDNVVSQAFKQRIKDYLVKAVREGKQYSNWKEPNQAFEASLCEWINKSDFSALAAFAARITKDAAQLSLSSLAIKILAPGIPDFYQGCELWDLSLVDPDNRRAVDFEYRRQLLESPDPALSSGSIKQSLMQRLLKLRGDHLPLFLEGDYVPLTGTSGIFAFARRSAHQVIVLAAALPGRELEAFLLSLWPDCPLLYDFYSGAPALVENGHLRLEPSSALVPWIFCSKTLL